MVIKLPLRDGYEVIFDDVDADLLEMPWRLLHTGKGKPLYAAVYGKRDGKTTATLMHRVIYERTHGVILTRKQLVDHHDRYSLNNQRHNLRLATPTRNLVNTESRRQRKYAGLPKGVRLTANGRYVTSINDHGKTRHLGTYDTPEQAAEVFRAAHVKLYGEWSPYYTDATDTDQGKGLQVEQTASGILVPVVYSLSNVREGEDAPATL